MKDKLLSLSIIVIGILIPNIALSQQVAILQMDSNFVNKTQNNTSAN